MRRRHLDNSIQMRKHATRTGMQARTRQSGKSMDAAASSPNLAVFAVHLATFATILAVSCRFCQPY
jgi:hypothetical protein